MTFVHDEKRYRREQEEFVSNHGGTSPQDLIFTIMPSITSLLLVITTLGVIGNHLNRHVKVVIEFALLVVPCILSYTIFSDYLVSINVAILLVSIINILLIGTKLDILSCGEPVPTTGRRPFLTNFRAVVYIVTITCILAVDFKAFPRRFVKTEVYGYSLMDTGVGFFVAINGFVAPEARDFEERPKLGFVKTITKNCMQCLKGSAPLLILGVGRFVAVEYLSYQKHVSEYGIHWNFFITLAFVKIFTSTITSTISSKYSLFSGIWILIMHEYILSTKGLKNWVLGNAPRDGFISANREGLISIPGYVGLYLISVAIGRLIHSTYRILNQDPKIRQPHSSFKIRFFRRSIEMAFNESMVLCIKLSLISAQMCGITLFCDKYFRISRRLANVGYCAWILTLTTAFLTILLLTEILSDMLIHSALKDENAESSTKPLSKNRKRNTTDKQLMETRGEIVARVPEIYEAINYNGLSFFLFANLLTGMINMTIKTLYVDEIRTVYILTAYMSVNVFTFLILYRSKIQLKL